MRAAIGVTGQFSPLDDLLTGEENLILMADLHHCGRAEGRARVADLIERFDLVEAARKPASTYSGGMRRKLDLHVQRFERLAHHDAAQSSAYLRYPSMTLILIALPIVFLLLFAYVLGGTLGAGLGGPSGGRAEYVNYARWCVRL